MAKKMQWKLTNTNKAGWCSCHVPCPDVNTDFDGNDGNEFDEDREGVDENNDFLARLRYALSIGIKLRLSGV